MAENSTTMNEMFTLIKGFIKDMNSRMQRLEEIHQKLPITEEENIQNDLDMGKEEKIMYFDKTTVEAENLKVGRIHATLMKSKEIDDYIFSMGGIASELVIQLPSKFAIPKTDRFTGIEDPKQHLLQYLSFIKIEGLNEQQVLYAFTLSLSRIATEWYYTLDVEKTKVWKELINMFMKQFAYNTMVDITFKDLETMQQNDNETFPEFQARWRAKAAKMMNRLAEKDQGWGLKTPFIVAELKRMKKRCLHLQRRFSEVQATLLMSKPTSMLFIQINTSAQANIRSSIGLNMVANPDMYLNLEGTSIHWVLPYPRSLFICARETGHSTDECTQLKDEIQDLIDQNVIIQPAKKAEDVMTSGCA
uniref:Retrotransposon gag domain-containing protein n=1 Tax=Fagus sylvatica TaxID=28930 RepID=A0A2N9FDS8_FAGSY